MKKYIILIILSLFPGIIVTAQTFSDDNFIYSIKPKKAVKAANFQSLAKDEMIQNVTYLDGLGRPVQTTAINQGGDGSDLITPIEYDGFGRQEKEYLPFSLPNPGSQYPRIDTQTAINNAISFYNTGEYYHTTNPFSQKKFENSPLNRVLKQAAPGKEWAMGEGHEIKIDYQTNKSNEVRLFEVITTWDAVSGLYDISFWDNGYYEENELYKTITYDENSAANPVEEDGSTVEFKNKEGQVVLKRTYNAKQPHDTYYVYDEYGNLTYVIPPKADGVITNEILDNLCYQYKYDDRNRMVEKKVPGKQWEFIVYNKRNSIVASGPAYSPFQDDNTAGWIITKYDVNNKEAYTGWINTACNSETRVTLQQSQNKAAVLFEKPSTITYGDGFYLWHTNNIEPTNFKFLTANRYNNHLLEYHRVRPLTTAASIAYENTQLTYDYRNRVIKTKLTNHLGGYTYTDYNLDFTGKNNSIITNHVAATGIKGVILGDYFTYSPQDRLLTHTHKINSANEQLIADNTYDSMGRLIKKNVGNTKAAPLEQTDYAYNIRGWLTNINNIRGKMDNTGFSISLFSMLIVYTDIDFGIGKVKSLYNGNIARTTWRTSTDGSILRDYVYHYDQLNRLTNAVYQTPVLTDKKNYFGESLEYDKNGNIQKLQRKFMAGLSSSPYADNMDDLNYFYKDNSNQLMKVTDLTNNPQGFKDDSDGFNDTEDDYDYDGNGNLTKDQNKKITEITYNHLNLPKKITFATGNTIDYIYNATGEKLEKNITENGVVTNTKYLNGGFQYKNNILQFFPTAEGYVRNTNETDGSYKFQYVFNYLDHLGNVRLSYAQNPTTKKIEILEENNYYPFGLKHQGYNTDNLQPNYKYKYQGQERQDELGLNWDSFKYRNYDYTIGRFMSLDPLAEKYNYQSPYNFSENRVVDGRELEGLEVVLINPTKSSSTEQQKVADQKIYNGSKNILNGNGLITVTGHGNPKRLDNDVRGSRIETASQLNAVLNRNSSEWKNKEKGEGMTVALYACRTGANQKNQDGSSKKESFAQNISRSSEFKDVEIIAPDQRVYFTDDGPIGTYKAEYAGENDEYKAGAKDHSMSNEPGNWNVFKNGELIRSYRGDWKPTNDPSIWDRLTKENK